MHSERPQHRMYEQWHPMGTIGIITAFNFPVAVWAWNAMLAAACGNTMIWKPSLVTPLCAIAMTKVAHQVMDEQDIFQPTQGDAKDVFGLIIGSDPEVGESMIHDRRLPLISATGPAAWAGWSALPWPNGWADRCSNWAATTPSSSCQMPIWIWRCGARSLVRSALPVNVAPQPVV